MPSFIERTKELRANGISALEAARQARAEMSNVPGTVSSSSGATRNSDGTLSFTKEVKPEGVMTTSTTNLDETIAAGQTYTPPTVTSAVATNATSGGTPAGISQTEPTKIETKIGGTTGTSGRTGVSNKNNKTNTLDTTLKTDITNTYDDNKKTIEQQKADDIKAAEDENAATVANLEAERLQKESAAIEEDRRQKERAEEDARIQRELDAKKRASDEANLRQLKAKQESEERQLKIDNDVAQQQSAIAFAKLGLSLSTAGITTAQQIFTTGAYNLAKLKTENAYEYAQLEEQVAKTEFDNTNAINKIIRDSEDKSYTLRKALNEEVYKIKNSIIKSNADKRTAISKAITEYRKARDENEAGTIKKMTERAELVKKETDAIYDTLKKKEEYANTHIDTLVNSGRWALLPDSEKVRLEKLAGVPFGTTDMKNKAMVGKNLYEQIENVTGLKGVTLSVSDYTKITQEAAFYMSNGRGMEDAMNMAINAHISKSPEMQAKMRELAKKGRTGGGSGGTKETEWKLTGYSNADNTQLQQMDKNGNIRWVEAGNPLKKIGTTDENKGKIQFNFPSKVIPQ